MTVAPGCTVSLRFHGAPGRSRTCDPRIRSPMLYPTELQARPISLVCYAFSPSVVFRAALNFALSEDHRPASSSRPRLRAFARRSHGYSECDPAAARSDGDSSNNQTRHGARSPVQARHRLNRAKAQWPRARTTFSQRTTVSLLPGSPDSCLRTAVWTITSRLFGSTKIRWPRTPRSANLRSSPGKIQVW